MCKLNHLHMIYLILCAENQTAAFPFHVDGWLLMEPIVTHLKLETLVKELIILQ